MAKRKGFKSPTKYSLRAAVVSASVCPKCGASQRDRCTGSQGQGRAAPHTERFSAYYASRDAA